MKLTLLVSCVLALFTGVPDDTPGTILHGESTVAEKPVNGGMLLFQPPLATMLKAGCSGELTGTGRLVLLDCYYNNEWKKDSSGKPVRYHYVWSDTANSGFSQLGAILTRAGAAIDTLNSAPTPGDLHPASVYIIVDPDTPLETQAPHFLQQPAIGVIGDWVRRGGVLVLLGNDKGNAEFSHFNQLAELFGIHFNEDSRNRVVGKEFATGTFDRFPDHPLFHGVRKIFIKELSTLQVQNPGDVLFSDGGDVVMAFVKAGKGAVFAVGDPWFYNEYMGHWRLPEGYDNAKTADNLFRWLLKQSGNP